MEFQLPYDIKKTLLEEILKTGNPFNLSENYTLPDFLLEILPLKDLPSQDSRFKNAYEDTFQHTVNNYDWEEEYVFDERFGIVSDDRLFKVFLERTINNSNEKNFLISIIQKVLKNFNFRIIQRYDVNSNIVYYVEYVDQSFNQIEFPLNNTPFYVVPYNRDKDADYPYFQLNSDSWNDFGYRTYFKLTYFETAEKVHCIGGIRIMKIGEPTTELPDSFLKLTSEYCSLMANEDHYFKLKMLFPERFKSILSALNDSAYFPTICEKFENDVIFKTSLCRDSNESEKLMRSIRYKLDYGDVTDFFDFNFLFRPLYSEFDVSFNFNFNVEKSIPKRLYIIIGKNGVGKTLMIRNLIANLSNKQSEVIQPRIPLFGKIIVVSYSYFDVFEDIRNRVDFNFLFCGLVDHETNKPLTNEELIIRVIEAFSKIEEKEIVNKFFWTCKGFLDIEILEEIFSWLIYYGREGKSIDDYKIVKIKKQTISEVLHKMSSGQKALFFIVSEIIANIRYNSLLVFDEPETHLHPNAITEFMSVIINLLQEFDSYGIIATHSPLIVREVFSDSIFVFEKDKDVPRVRKLEFETFGENLSTITSEIFGNRDVPKYFIESIKKLVNNGQSYEEIESALQGEVPLGLNLKILIKSLLKNRDEES